MYEDWLHNVLKSQIYWLRLKLHIYNMVWWKFISIHKCEFELLNWNDWGVNELCFATKHWRLNQFTNFAGYLLINVQVQYKWSTFQKFVVCKICLMLLKVSYAHQGLIYTLKIVILLNIIAI